MDPEMMRLLEILRPLWPGLVKVTGGKDWLRMGNEKVQLDVEPDGPRWKSTVYVDSMVVAHHTWLQPENAAPVLENQAKRARERTEALMGAFGWEVSQ